MSDLYNWKRFWYLRGTKPYLSNRGYLYDPDTEPGRLINPSVTSFDDVTEMPCLVLLGEPGMGKSMAMKAHRPRLENHIAETSDYALWRDLRAYQSEDRLYTAIFEHPTFRTWLDGTQRLYLFLDSLDEGLLRINTIAAFLSETFHNYPTDRLFLRIACRTAEWPQSFEQNLKETWGEQSVQVYELAPLRDIDVAEAARANNIDAERFLTEIESIQVVPLAIKPITLDFLLNKYRVTGKLPSQQTDLYRDGCLLLCEETSEGRRDAKLIGRYSAKQRLSMAARIAAVTVFGNRYAIWTDIDRGDIPAEDVTIQELCSDSLDNIPAKEDLVRETLSTGLFSSRGAKRLGWAHQTYAEFLAAYYLVQQRVVADQIMRLITHPDGKLVPQLYETAAWIAGMHSSIFREIVTRDPEVLLRSDIAVATPKDRAALIDSLLHLHDTKELMRLDRDLRTYYARLAHPELARQLKPYILDRTKNTFVRQFAIDVAEACQLNELEGALLQVCLNSSDEIWVRVTTAEAIYHIGSEQAKARLKPLLTEATGDDPNDELKGYALLALWPKYITTAEVFAVLSLPKRESYFGAYRLFLNKVHEDLEVADLPIALSWVEKQPRRHQEGLLNRNLLDAIMLKAWDNLEEPEILEAFAKAAYSRLQIYDAIIGDSDRVYKLWEPLDPTLFGVELSNSHEKRRAVLETILPLFSDETSVITLIWSSTPLVTQNDLHWMLERLELEGSEDMQRKWAHLIYRSLLLNLRNYENIDGVFTVSQRNPILAQHVRSLFDPIERNSEAARQAKENSHKWRELEKRHNEQPILDPPLPERIATLLDQFEAGDLSAWWRLNLQLTIDPNNVHDGDEFEADLTVLPGWAVVDSATKTRIINAAKQYVLVQDPDPNQWFGENILYRPAFAGFHALFLLFHEAPDFLMTLSSDVWKRWGSTIVAYPMSAQKEQPHQELINIAYQHAPSEMIGSLMVVIDKENREHSLIFVIRKFEKCWDEQLAEALLNKVQQNQESLSPNSINALLDNLLEKETPGAKIYAEFLISRRLMGEVERSKAIIAGSLLMMYAGDASWSVIWPVMQEDAEFGRDVITRLARSERRAAIAVASHLTDVQLADLYIWVTQQYPHNEDPDVDGFHAITDREEIGRWRNYLLEHLQNRGTTQSVHEVRRIVQRFPEIDQVRYSLTEAQRITRLRTWTPSSPAEVLRLSSENAGIVEEHKVLIRWLRVVTFGVLAVVEVLVFLFSFLWLLDCRCFEPAIFILGSILSLAVTVILYERAL